MAKILIKKTFSKKIIKFFFLSKKIVFNLKNFLNLILNDKKYSFFYKNYFLQ